jgi:DNA-binding NarL/FixJ family response regulator
MFHWFMSTTVVSVLPAEPPVVRSRLRCSSVHVAVCARDPLVRAGLVSKLSGETGIELQDDLAAADVVVVDSVADTCELLAASLCVVLVTDEPRAAELRSALEQGVVVVVPQRNLAAPSLVRAIMEVKLSSGVASAEDFERAVEAINRTRDSAFAGEHRAVAQLSRREIVVLRMLANGYDTAEIGIELNYSERTVKNTIHALLSRLELRNRVHAVAYVIRQGLI